MDAETQNLIYIMLFTIYGMVFGSFATALIYRMPRDENWVHARSKCPKCGHKLNFLDLFPVFSWLFTRGKCRYCKTSFGRSYVYIELLMAALFTTIYLINGLSVQTIIICLLGFATVVLSAIDFEHYIIPDEVNIFVFILGVVYQVSISTDVEFLVMQLLVSPLAMFAFAMFLRWLMYFLKKREGLGFGDVKFFIAAGTFMTLENFSIFLFMSGIIGIIIAIIWRLLKKGEVFPFGPALSIALLLCVIYPQIGSYLNNSLIKTFY
jgi:leader peptidase (prepilin peptidase)/N-methyltransferase